MAFPYENNSSDVLPTDQRTAQLTSWLRSLITDSQCADAVVRERRRARLTVSYMLQTRYHRSAACSLSPRVKVQKPATSCTCPRDFPRSVKGCLHQLN